MVWELFVRAWYKDIAADSLASRQQIDESLLEMFEKRLSDPILLLKNCIRGPTTNIGQK